MPANPRATSGHPTFRYDELPEHSIRLLEFLSLENEPSEIVLQLKTSSINDAPEFSALSYVWGQESGTCNVQCVNELTLGGALMPITSNLLGALPFLRAFSKRPIWIDAICINQDDLDEKARVIPRMNEIYGQAAEVLIWLGPQGDDSQFAIDVLNWISHPDRREDLQPFVCGVHGFTVSHLRTLKSMIESDTETSSAYLNLERFGLPGITHPLWLALPALYRREWFFRVWTFQEAMLAKNATVLCGDRSIAWTAFRQLGLALMDTQLLWVSQTTQSLSPLRNFRHPHNHGEWFWFYLRGSRDRKCSKKEDRVYGMLALAPSTVRQEIKVEYKSDTGHYIQVYRLLAIALLRQMPLEILFDAAISAGKPAAMPSWCPDWSLKQTSNPLFPRFRSNHVFNSLRSWTIDPLDHNILRVSGMQIDQVQDIINEYSWDWPNGVSGIGGPAHRMLQWLDRCAALARQAVSSGEEHQAVYWQTMLAYSPLRNPENFPANPILGLAAHRKRLAENRDCKPLTETALSSQELNALGPTLAHLGRVWRGKVFFSTMQGRVGIADRGVAIGDSLCIIFGAYKHYVFRPLANNTHCLMSVAYIHGLMADIEDGLKKHDLNIVLPQRMKFFRIR